MEALIDEYVKKIEDIYRRGTVGDYTWYGLLCEFARRIEEVKAGDHSG